MKSLMNRKRYRKLQLMGTDHFSEYPKLNNELVKLKDIQNCEPSSQVPLPHKKMDISKSKSKGETMSMISARSEVYTEREPISMYKNNSLLDKNKKLEQENKILRLKVKKYSERNTNLHSNMKNWDFRRNQHIKEMEALRKEKFIWESRCKNAESKLEMAENLDEILIEKNQLQHDLLASNYEVETLKKSIEAREKENDTIKTEFQSKVMKKIKEYESLQLEGTEISFKKLFMMMYRRIESMLECPITRERMKTPMVLPSGNTIEKSFMDLLIPTRKFDPFDKNKV